MLLRVGVDVGIVGGTDWVVVTATGAVVIGVIENDVVFAGRTEGVVVTTVNGVARVDVSNEVVVIGVLVLNENGGTVAVVAGVVVVLKENDGVVEVVGSAKLKEAAEEVVGAANVAAGVGTGAEVVVAPNGATVAVCVCGAMGVAEGKENDGATEAEDTDVVPNPNPVVPLIPKPVVLPSDCIGADVEIVAGVEVNGNERVGVVVVAVVTPPPKLKPDVEEGVADGKAVVLPKLPKAGAAADVGTEDMAISGFGIELLNQI